MITPTVVTEPAIEPVSINEAKDHLRVDGTTEDALIQEYIKAARRHFEWRTGRTIYETTYDVTFDGFPTTSNAIILPRATPLVLVTHVKYTDSAGTETTWANDQYVLDTYNMPGLIKPAYGVSYPTFTPYPVNPVVVRYVAGKAATGEIVESIKAPILLLVGGLYQVREPHTPANVAKVAHAYGVEAFIAQHTVEYVF